MVDLISLFRVLMAVFAIGGGTFYGGSKFEGQPLYCGGRYERSTGPWVALPEKWYKSGKAQCGDIIIISYPDGNVSAGIARDAGYLSKYRIFDSGRPFVVDQPYYWRNGKETQTVIIFNLSAWQRQHDYLSASTGTREGIRTCGSLLCAPISLTRQRCPF